MTKRRRGSSPTIGPPPPLVPVGQPNEDCGIVFGHSTDTKKVLMQFSLSVSTVVFEPENARHVARQLLVRADLAEGKKVSG